MPPSATTSPRRGRTLLLLLIALALAPSSRAQEFAFGIGGTSTAIETDEGRDIVLDASGNVYVIGHFRGTNVNFDPAGSALLSSNTSSSDIFLASYTSAGAYRWAFRLGSSGDDRGLSLAIDGSDHLYVTGYFRGTNVDFDPGAGTALLTSAGNNDLFVASYTSAGAYRWALRVGRASNDRGQGITIGPSGHVWVTGHFQGSTVDFDPGAGATTLTSAGVHDIYVASYTNTGTFRSAFRVGSTGEDRGRHLAVDPSGNIYVTGYFALAPDFDPGAGVETRTSAGSSDIFVASYTSANAFRWTFRVGSTEDDRGHDIVLDASNNVYVGGYFRSMNVDFDPGAGVAARSSAGANDLFLASYTSAGDFRFAHRAGSTSNDRVQALTVDGSNNVYITGHFQGSNIDFDPGAGTALLTSAGSTDFYVASYTSAGDFRAAFSAGSAGAERGQGIAINGAGRGFTTGFFASTVDFDPDAGTRNATSNGGPDAFVASYTAQTLPVELTTFSGSRTASGVALRWETATETNNAGFEVERSGVGGAWQSVGFVAGRGTTTAPGRYTFTDGDLPFEAPSLRYRLRQIDFDGAFSYSPEVEIARALPAALGLHAAYPNPFAEETTIRYELPTGRDVRIEVFDALGRSVRVLVDGPQPAGRHAAVFHADGLPSGAYVYRIETDGRVETRRMLLVR